MPYLTDAQIQKMVNRAVAKALRGDQAKTVSEIVGPAADPGGEGAFSRALREDATSDGHRQHTEIVNTLRSNPELVINPTAEWAFRHNYPWIDYATMSGLIDEATGRRK